MKSKIIDPYDSEDRFRSNGLNTFIRGLKTLVPGVASDLKNWLTQSF